MGQRKKKQPGADGGKTGRESGPEEVTEKNEPLAAEPEDGNAERKGEAPPEADGLEVLREENEKLRDKWLRAVAELDNFRKRAARDRQREILFARTAAIVPLLEVLDDVERAVDHEGASVDDLRRGIEMIRDKFIDKLASIGVEAIESMEKPFDPERMDALATVPCADVPAGTVIGEIRKGYLLNDAVIRHAQVSVAAVPDDDGPDGDEKGRSEG